MSDKATSRLDEYLTVSEAAAYLGVSSATLRNWDRSGKLKPYRHPVNGYRLYKMDDLSQVLEGIKEGKTV